MIQRPNYRFGDFVLHPAARELVRRGERVTLPSRVFDCLLYLIEHRDRAVGRDELAAAVWGSVDVSDAQLSQAILRARRAVGDAGNDQACIRTMPKFGYRWVAEVEPTSVPSAPAPTATPAAEPADPVPSASAPVDATPPDAAPVDATAPTPAAPPARRRRVLLPLAAAGVLAVAAVLAWVALSPPFASRQEAPARTVLVLPFEVGDSAAKWIRLGAIDTVADRLRAAGLPVPPSETTLALLGAGDASPAALRARANAAWIVGGRAERSALGWRARLSASDATGTVHEAEMEAEDVLDAFRSATDLLLRQLGLAPPGGTVVPHALDEPLQRIQAALLENAFADARHVVASAPALLADPLESRLQLAQIDQREGKLEAAAAGIEAVLADEAAAARPWLRARAEVLLGSIDLMLDKAAAAEDAFERALPLLDPAQHPLDRAHALAGRGAARASQGLYAEALDDLGQARILMQQNGDLLAQARMDLLTGSVEHLRRRPMQARRLLEAALDRLQHFGAWNERMHGYAELVQCAVEMLDYRAAEAASDAALALMPKVDDPLHRAETLLYRIQLRVLQGRFGEAAPLFGQFQALNLAGHPRMQGIAHALRAQQASELGDHAATIREADEAIRRLPGNERDGLALVALWRARAQLALGDADGAERALAALPPVVRREPVPVPLALARIELDRHRGEAAVPRLDALIEDTERAGVPADELLAIQSRVRQLLDDGRPDEAAPLLGRLAPVAGQDYRYALLELHLAHAGNRLQAWRQALDRASQLAGERAIPPPLRQPPLG